jgi:hypothetical protein
LKQLVARACQKKTGLLLSTNPAKKTQGLLKNTFDVLRPEKGDRILNSFDAKHFYSNIGDYKGGEKGFFGVLAENGADLGKMLKNMKKDQPVLEAMYKEAGKQGSIFSASNKDVLEALGKAFDSNSGDLKKALMPLNKHLPIQTIFSLTLQNSTIR